MASRRRLLTLALVAVAALWAGPASGGEGQDEPLRPRPDVETGERRFQRDCAVCHGPQGEGSSRGPNITDAGAAGVHFYVSTGRMPIADPEQPARRRDPVYSPEEIEALVAYTDTILGGPAAAGEVEVTPVLLSEGGAAYRLNCASCHQFLGVGGVLIGEPQAPSLTLATPAQVVEAIRVGPGTMPKYSDEEITEEEARAIASYVALEIQQPTDDGGLSLGHFGPVTEGAVAWGVGMLVLLGVARWIGRRT